LTLERIKALYAIEQTLREHPPDGRTALRQESSQPLLDALHAWLLGQRQFLAKADVRARAIDYALGRWRALCVFATDGRVPIDNNAVENAIRPLALGHRNWLFVGSSQAGSRASRRSHMFE
jgi:hypothetical protein